MLGTHQRFGYAESFPAPQVPAGLFEASALPPKFMECLQWFLGFGILLTYPRAQKNGFTGLQTRLTWNRNNQKYPHGLWDASLWPKEVVQTLTGSPIHHMGYLVVVMQHLQGTACKCFTEGKWQLQGPWRLYGFYSGKAHGKYFLPGEHLVN